LIKHCGCQVSGFVFCSVQQVFGSDGARARLLRGQVDEISG